MKKIVFPILFVFLLAPNLLAFRTADNPAARWSKTYKLSTFNKSQIKNPKGEIIGEIEDFVMDPRGGRIALVIFSHTGMAGMGHQVKIIPYEFLSFDETGKNFVLDVSKDDLTSPIEVRNLQGEKLGEIGDFIIDPQGRIPFVMLLHGGKMIFIPYGALSVDGNSFVLDASREKLASAPGVGQQGDSVDRGQAEKIYRYFGQSPYWSSE